MRGAFHALLDTDDRVLSGDACFAELNDRAGGRIGAALALAAVAALVRIARGLRVPVARTIAIGDDESDGDWHVRAVPDADGTVALAATLLRERPCATSSAGAIVAAEPPADAAWSWEVDSGLRITRVDAVAMARHGIDPVAVLGQPLTTLFVLEARGDGAMPLLESVSNVRDFGGQAAVVRASGARVALAGRVRYDAAGGFAGFVGGVYTGVAAGVRDGLTGAFNARLHRVLRAPLDTIITQAESISGADEAGVGAHYRDYAADIASAGRHLMGLVDDLVDMEAIERGDLVVARMPLDLAAVAREGAGLLAARAAARAVTIAPLAGEASAMALGDYRRALQIVLNLLGNAIDYSPEGGVVRMRAKRRDAQVRLLVADEGRGIAPPEQARIFEKFVRGDDSVPGGSGLGLYIARRLAQAMDGALTVESELGQGACFTLALPAASAQAPGEQDQQQAEDR
ncbi:sensor histidine kinase [Sphingomonas phyllosphaerae]|uniref:sensor histidine kinase n=1 Tax=Sphingomonas phyllosphaerae TaxID=257003 RepID=UPI000426F1E5|nr:HAMP domain-containing sensor histidine kinase [Sphingomonas phyllosphaerae]